MVSRVVCTGLRNRTPCQPSITRGPRAADAQQESAARQLLQAQRRGRQQRRTARTQLHHKRSELDRRRLGREVRQSGECVVTPHLGHPQRVDTDPLGGHCELDCARRAGVRSWCQPSRSASLSCRFGRIIARPWHAASAGIRRAREAPAVRYRDQPTIEVTQRVRCDVATAWKYVTDIKLPGAVLSGAAGRRMARRRRRCQGRCPLSWLQPARRVGNMGDGVRGRRGRRSAPLGVERHRPGRCRRDVGV